jgi:hypothetical protein
MINLRNCKFVFKCTANWDEMTTTEDNLIRHCESCKKNVYYIREPEELMKAIKLNRCVAIYDFAEMKIFSGVPGRPVTKKPKVVLPDDFPF